jgi:hypothetical protein
MQSPIRVECYSGHTYAQEPRAFEWEGQRYQVEQVVKRWRTPAGPCFRVEVAGISNLKSLISHFVDLTYLESTDQWTMTVQTKQEDQR